MKNIQIHCVDDAGTPFIMNRLTSENAEAHTPEKRTKLAEHAKKMAYDWSVVFPHDKFVVVEV